MNSPADLKKVIKQMQLVYKETIETKIVAAEIWLERCSNLDIGRFSDLKDDDKAKLFKPIFEYVLIRKCHDAGKPVEICPFYHQGYLPDDTVYNHKELAIIKRFGAPKTTREVHPVDVDLALLAVNKSIRTMCSEIFYSNHVFVFNDARSCFWFFRRIGRANLRNITTMVFNISSGYFLSMKHRSIFDVCEEAQWCQIFAFLKVGVGHGIKQCVIRFCDLDTLGHRTDLLEDDDKIDISQARNDLVAIISRFRGMKTVLVQNQDCTFVGLRDRRKMAKLMVSSEEDVPVMSDAMEHYRNIEALPLAEDEIEQELDKEQEAAASRKWSARMVKDPDFEVVRSRTTTMEELEHWMSQVAIKKEAAKVGEKEPAKVEEKEPEFRLDEREVSMSEAPEDEASGSQSSEAARMDVASEDIVFIDDDDSGYDDSDFDGIE